MENNVAPVRLNKLGNSRSTCWKHIKLMEDDDPRIIKYEPNHANKCALCNMILSLIWAENKNRKYSKANVNHQTAHAIRHLIK